MINLGINIWSGQKTSGLGAIITTNRAFWYRKATASGASWPDASGLARNLALTGSPTIGATSVTFSGTGQYGTAAFAFGAPCTIYIRVKQVSWTAGRSIFAGAATGSLRLEQQAGGASPLIYLNDSLGFGGGGVVAVSLPVGTFGNVGCMYSGGLTDALNLNGTDMVTNDAIGTGDTIASGFTLAANSSAGASPSNIEVVEVIGYSAAHSLSERAQMMSYMSTL